MEGWGHDAHGGEAPAELTIAYESNAAEEFKKHAGRDWCPGEGESTLEHLELT